MSRRSRVFFFFFSLCRRFFFSLSVSRGRKKNSLTENQRRDAGDDSQLRQSQAKKTTADDILCWWWWWWWWCVQWDEREPFSYWNSDGEKQKKSRQQIACSFVINSLLSLFRPQSRKSLTLAPTTTAPLTKEGTGLRAEGGRAGTKRLGEEEDGATATEPGEQRTATVVVVKERREADAAAAPRTEEPAPARAWSVACMISLARVWERETECDCRQEFGVPPRYSERERAEIESRKEWTTFLIAFELFYFLHFDVTLSLFFSFLHLFQKK